MDPSQIDPSGFPELAQLFGAYLHQDYDLEHGSPEAAIEAFRDESEPAERTAVLAEADRLVALFSGDAELTAALRRLGFGLHPERDGEPVRAWLLRTRAILAASS